MTVVCFHNPDEENGVFSNWYLSDFSFADRTFTSMEQYMMYKKAECFCDTEIADRIMSTSNVAEIKKLGRLVHNYDDHVWSGLRQVVVYEGLLEKFLQNDFLKQALLATGDAVLAECAVRDLVWGIGLSMTDPNRFDRTKWKGKNLLGYSLMMVRAKIA